MTRESSNGHEQQYNVELVIDQIVLRYQARPTALIMVLQDIQKHFRYLPEDALREVARRMNLPIAQIYSVATFYRAFSLKPKGAHHICVCTGTACHVRQAAVIVDNLARARDRAGWNDTRRTNQHGNRKLPGSLRAGAAGDCG